jgi:hypothetical protein
MAQESDSRPPKVCKRVSVVVASEKDAKEIGKCVLKSGAAEFFSTEPTLVIGKDKKGKALISEATLMAMNLCEI